MKMPWSREAVQVLPANIDLSKQPWCRQALLLQVRGTGTFRWETRDKPPGADPCESAFCLTLRGTPLLSWQAAVCETTESWLCAGWGLDTAECPELEALRSMLEGGFSSLEAAVPLLSPLLELLPNGQYVLAEMDACPADGAGRFFWDVPDSLEVNPATGMVYLNDDDYDFRYEHLPPVFLYPSQKRSRLNMERVDYYRQRFREDGLLPHGIAFSVTEGVSVLLDGHHKAAAAALLGRMLPCLTVIRLEHYLLRPVTVPPRHVEPIVPRRYEEYAGCFGPITIPIADMGPKPPKEPWRFARGSGPLPKGRLTDGELPEELRTAGKRYPTAEGYALVSAAGIGCPTDEDLQAWLADIGLHRPKLRAALVLLRSRGDSRLKTAALRCAAVEDIHCSLKEEAFEILAEMKGDADAEDFFIDFFVETDDPGRFRSGQLEHLINIAHSFWN